MANAVTVRAPGKILLLGGYAVLERPNVAYVLTVDKYVRAELQPLRGQAIILDLPNFGFSLAGDATLPTLPFSGDPVQLEKAKFVIQAIRACQKYLEYKQLHFQGFKLTTRSDAAFQLNAGKSGLGSSAAVTVATVAAVLRYHDHSVGDFETVHKISQFAHAHSQGKVGSGFDIAAACYGSIEYVRYSPSCINFDRAADVAAFGQLIDQKWDYQIQKTEPPQALHLAMANIPGTSASTSTMVKLLNEWKKKNPGRYAEIMQTINIADRLAIVALRKNKPETFAKHFNAARVETRKLGEAAGIEIEPPSLTSLVEASLQHGAFVCRLPGAGGGDSIVAFTQNGADTEKLHRFWEAQGLHPLRVHAVGEGIQHVR